MFNLYFILESCNFFLHWNKKKLVKIQQSWWEIELLVYLQRYKIMMYVLEIKT